MKRLSFCTLSPIGIKCGTYLFGTVEVPKADTPTEAVESIMCTEESLRERVVNSLGGVECPSFNLFSTKEQAESRLVGLSQRVSSAVDFDTVTSNVLEELEKALDDINECDFTMEGIDADTVVSRMSEELLHARRMSTNCSLKLPKL